jgi:hypothetical protein
MIKRPRDLLRTRRRGWPLAAGLVLALGATGALLAPKAARDGWTAVIPGSVLVFVPTDPVQLARRLSGTGGASGVPIIEELGDRVSNDALARWQERQVVSSIRNGLSKLDLYGVDEESRGTMRRLGRTINPPPSGVDPGPRALRDVLSQVSTVVGVQVEIDAEALALAGLTEESSVAFWPRGEERAAALDRLQEELNSVGGAMLRWMPRGGAVVFVSDFARGTERWQVFEIGDVVKRTRPIRGSNVAALFAGETMQGSGVEELIELIAQTISPDLWLSNGGRQASAVGLGGGLLVEAPVRELVRVDALLSLLRDPALIAETPSDAQVRQFLASVGGRSVRTSPGPFEWEIFRDELLDQAGLGVELGAGLAAPTGPIEEAPGRDQDRARGAMTIAAALDVAAEALDRASPGGPGVPPVGWRALEPGRIVFAREERASTTVAIYRVADVGPLAEGGGWRDLAERAEQLRAHLEQSVEPAAWVDAGGDVAWCRVWDPAEPRLVICATSSMHERIGRILAELRARPSGEAER